MKSSDVKSLTQPLLPLLAGFRQKGAMLYKESAGLLRGIYFEDSGFDKEAFYVWAFYLPLYVPTTHVSFTFGRRLVAGKRWKLDTTLPGKLASAIRDEALPFLGKAETPERFAEEITSIAENPRDPYVLQANAYSLAKSGNATAASSGLKQLISVLNEMGPSLAWVGEMRGRGERLLGEMEKNISSAKQLLDEWEAGSRKNLRLVEVNPTRQP